MVIVFMGYKNNLSFDSCLIMKSLKSVS
jgi:hypothetical protein